LSNNPSISWLLFVFLTVVLTTGITIPAIQSQPSQSGAADVSQIVKQISERVTSANPDTDAVFVEQILTELARKSSLVPNQGNILKEIYSQILTYPYGIESQSLARFGSLLSSDSSILIPIVQKIFQEQASGKNPIQSIVNIAVQDATGGGRNVNDEIALAAQIIAKQSPGIPVRNIESIIIQMALEISRAQGKAITGQTIFEIANQIKQNPNGVLTQAILQLAKQDAQDNGKAGQTSKIIKTVIVESKKSEEVSQKDKVVQSVGAPNKLGSPVPSTPKIISGSERLGNLILTIGRAALPGDIFSIVNDIVNKIPNISTPTSKEGAILALVGAGLQVLNSVGQSQTFDIFSSLKTEVDSNPTPLHRVGQLAALYKSEDDVSAAEVSNILADKLTAGIDPAVAIAEIPIPVFTTFGDEIPGKPESMSANEIEVKSLPSSENITIPADEGMEIVQLDLPFEPEVIPEPALSRESAIIPGLGVLAPQPDFPLPPDTVAPAPTSEDALPPGQPSGTDLSFVPGDPSQPGVLRIPSEIVCLGNSDVCTEPPSTSTPIEICQEQWYLPECTQNGSDIQEDPEGSNGALPQVPYNDEGGYQQLPYYYEPEGYLEGEDQYSEDSNNEEDDYEGGYQEYEQDYSEEEDSGDEEDDYEEVGNYQEEEENYSEEEVEEDEGGEEEDFTEEEEESGEYNEE
jgi:hypothetical protein